MISHGGGEVNPNEIIPKPHTPFININLRLRKTKDCKFTYDEPTKGTRREIPGFPSKPADSADAWYHTHLPVNFLDRWIGGARPEQFSDRDKQLSNITHSTGYLGYDGNIYIYTPGGN